MACHGAVLRMGAPLAFQDCYACFATACCRSGPVSFGAPFAQFNNSYFGVKYRRIAARSELPLKSWRPVHYGWACWWAAGFRLVSVVSSSMTSAMVIVSWQGQDPVAITLRCDAPPARSCAEADSADNR